MMESKTKRLLLIGGSVVVIAGVAYYLYKQNKPSDESVDVVQDDAVIDNQPNPNPSPSPSPNPSPQPIVNAPSALNTTDKIKRFQDFMDIIGPWVKGSDGKFKKLNKGGGYGNYGPSTRAAYSAYAELYNITNFGGSKSKIIPMTGPGSVPSIDFTLSDGSVARYHQNKDFILRKSEDKYSGTINRGTWSNSGRKITISILSRPTKTFSTNNFFDTLKLAKKYY
jgi:hypothetical protein